MDRRNFVSKTMGAALLLTLAPLKALKASTRSLDLNELASKVRIITRGSSSFKALTKVFNLFKKPSDPDAIIRSKKTQDYGEVVKFAANKIATRNDDESKHLKIRMRCGGHSYEYFSMGKGIVCDVREFKQIKINKEENTAILGSGLLLGEAIKGLGKHSLAIPTGSCPSVGISGLTLGGGLGLKGRTWGLTCDKVKSMNVVLASGDQVNVSSTNEYSDLGWAMLGGGGGNFALVTDYEFELQKTMTEILYVFKFHERDFNTIFNIFENQICLDDSRVTGILQLSTSKSGKISITLSGLFNGYTGPNSKSAMENFLISETQSMYSTLVRLAKSKRFIKRSSDSVRTADKPTRFKAKSHFSIDGLGSSDKYDLIKRTLKKNSSSKYYNPAMILGALGGQYDKLKYDNAYPHRDCRFSIEYYRKWGGASLNNFYQNQVNSIFEELDEIMDKKAYVNYPDFDLEDWAERYYGQNLKRLLQVKEKYDPNYVFDYGKHSLSSLLK